MKYKNINQYYVFQTAVSLLIALAAGAMWTLYFLKAPTLHGFNAPLFWVPTILNIIISSKYPQH